MTRRKALGALAVAAASVSVPACNKQDADAKAKAIPSKQGLTADGNPNPTSDDRCPMCAMRAADHPAWAGAIVLHNGDTFYTCSVRCTLATAMDSDTFLGVPQSDIARVRVPHYLEKGKSLDAESAWYVVDSDVRGPMGLALLPAATEQEAQILVRRHKGRVLPRKEVTLPLLKDLKQRSQGH
jgi:nitrous oxide reductase accessory protein NosL